MKIESTDGTSNTIKICDDDGKPMANITKIVLHPITCDTHLIEATITFTKVKCDIKFKEKKEA